MTVSVLWHFLTMPWVGLECAIVVFPNHTHFLYLILIVLNGFVDVLNGKWNSQCDEKLVLLMRIRCGLLSITTALKVMNGCKI